MRSLKSRIEKLEEEATPEEFGEFKITNIPDCMPELKKLADENNEITVRYPKTKRRKR